MPARASVRPARAGLQRSIAGLALETATFVKYRWLVYRRDPGWFVTNTLSPFLLLAPFVFLAESMLSRPGAVNQRFVELTGYTNYVGYLVIPLVAVNLSNTVFTAVAQVLRQEQIAGTLERVLVAAQYPLALPLGQGLAHLAILSWFVTVTSAFARLWLGLELQADVPAACVVVALHLLLTYGLALALSSLFLWLPDASDVQQIATRLLLSTLAGATFPVTLLPGWLQHVAWLIPFTWAFELERRALLRTEGLSDMYSEVLVLAGMTLTVWGCGLWLFQAMLRRARRTGHLGIY